MTEPQPPIRLDPLQNIIGFNWGFPAAALRFRAWWVGETHNLRNFSVNLPQISVSFPIAGAETSSKYARHPIFPPYHTSTSSSHPGITTNTYTYHYEVTFNHPPDSGSGSGTIIVTSSVEGTFWSSDGGASGGGDIGAAEAWYLANGWDTFSASLIDSSSFTGPPYDIFTDEDAALLVFNLAAIKKQINNPLVLAALIEFETGDPPPLVEGHAQGTYDWRSNIDTRAGATFFSFPLTPTFNPNNWRPSVATRQDDGSNNVLIRYSINFNTLAITRI